jgi:hypothetical protein
MILIGEKFKFLRLPMVALNEPKWKKFLSLKGQESNASNVKAVENDTKAPANASANLQSPADTPKKRKRTEEEIALRKAKKLKSKGKESQEWKQLSDDKSLSAETPKVESPQKVDEERPAATEPTSEQAKTTTLIDQAEGFAHTSKTEADAALLSTKAKEIAKARREEKLQEKKAPKKKVKEAIVNERKATDVQMYLDNYHAHVTHGITWKFKKQHQNWIVKHLYSYKWKDEDQVVEYLKTVQGQARERLVTEAREVVRLAEEEENAHGQDVVERAQRVINALGE